MADQRFTLDLTGAQSGYDDQSNFDGDLDQGGDSDAYNHPIDEYEYIPGIDNDLSDNDADNRPYDQDNSGIIFANELNPNNRLRNTSPDTLFVRDDDDDDDDYDEYIGLRDLDSDEDAFQDHDGSTGDSPPAAAADGADDLGDVDDTVVESDVDGPATKRRKTEKDTKAKGAKQRQPIPNPLTTMQIERSAAFMTIEGAPDFTIESKMEAPQPSSPSGPANPTFGRANREKGCALPAYSRRVTHDLDTDDETIMNMRNTGSSDKKIAEHLAQTKNIRYDPKSISTRIQRIRQAQADRAAWEIENGIKQWSFADDKLLLECYDIAQIEIAYEIERLRAWRFKKTAEWMRRANKDSVFSAKACQERYTALINGTAKPAWDVDDDPNARQEEMEQRRQECESDLQKKRDEEEAEENKSAQAKAEIRERKAKKAQEIAERRLKESKKKASRATDMALKHDEKARKAMEHLKAKEKELADRQAKKEADAAERRFREEFSSKNFKHITEDSPDPRADLVLMDLQALCDERKIGIHGEKNADPKTVLLKRLRNFDETLREHKLKTLCREWKIPLGGNKLQMRYQLALAAAKQCPSHPSNIEHDDNIDGDDQAEVNGEDQAGVDGENDGADDDADKILVNDDDDEMEE